MSAEAPGLVILRMNRSAPTPGRLTKKLVGPREIGTEKTESPIRASLAGWHSSLPLLEADRPFEDNC